MPAPHVIVDLSALEHLTNAELLKLARDNNQNVFAVKRRIRQLLADFPPPTKNQAHGGPHGAA